MLSLHKISIKGENKYRIYFQNLFYKDYHKLGVSSAVLDKFGNRVK
jgi:hypothetical protein